MICYNCTSKHNYECGIYYYFRNVRDLWTGKEQLTDNLMKAISKTSMVQ